MKYREEYITEKQLRRKTLVAFLFFFLFLAITIGAWLWLHRQPKEQGTLKPLRTVLNTNENVFLRLFSNERFAKTFPKNMAAPVVRANGNEGLTGNFDAGKWEMNVIRKPGDTLRLSMTDIRSLPRTEVIFDFKCIEGWSQVSHWAGVRFSDFVKKYRLEENMKLEYTGLSTPDNGYYVGIDNKSMMHPQTLLCYELNGKPLPMKHGAPLRLIIPVKYGIKHLKRIGSIYFSNSRPPDYWYERGYDYYSGL